LLPGADISYIEIKRKYARRHDGAVAIWDALQPAGYKPDDTCC
jgi:hypothetical protein